MKDYNVKEGTAYTIDWDAFRMEAAKTAMLGIMVGKCGFRSLEDLAGASVRLADELIKQLKEEKK